MTRDDIIRMAREQGLPETATEGVFRVNTDDLGRMLAAEREACKQACEELRGTVSLFASSKDCRTHNNAIAGCIKAISARGAAAPEAKP